MSTHPLKSQKKPKQVDNNFDELQLTPLLIQLDIGQVDVYYRTGIKPNRLSKISKEFSSKATAEEFYLIALSLGFELSDLLNRAYGSLKIKDISIEEVRLPGKSNKLTPYGKYLSDSIPTKRYIATIAGLSPTRVSTLSGEGGKAKVYLSAKELYLTARALNHNPVETFNKLYGHLRLNSAEEQHRLMIEYQDQKRSKRK